MESLDPKITLTLVLVLYLIVKDLLVPLTKWILAKIGNGRGHDRAVPIGYIEFRQKFNDFVESMDRWFKTHDREFEKCQEAWKERFQELKEYLNEKIESLEKRVQFLEGNRK